MLPSTREAGLPGPAGPVTSLSWFFCGFASLAGAGAAGSEDPWSPSPGRVSRVPPELLPIGVLTLGTCQGICGSVSQIPVEQSLELPQKPSV